MAYAPTTETTNETPWDQTIEFLAATTTIVHPGGLTAYGDSSVQVHCLKQSSNMSTVEPRPVGSSATDVTGFVPG